MPHTATATATEHPRSHRVFRRARKFCHIFSSFTFNFFHDLLVVFVAVCCCCDSFFLGAHLPVNAADFSFALYFAFFLLLLFYFHCIFSYFSSPLKNAAARTVWHALLIDYKAERTAGTKKNNTNIYTYILVYTYINVYLQAPLSYETESKLRLIYGRRLTVFLYIKVSKSAGSPFKLIMIFKSEHDKCIIC